MKVKRASVAHLLLVCSMALILACSGADNESTVKVGESRIKLIPYPSPGFTLIDDSNGRAYAAAVKLLGGGEPVLAIYTDSIGWNKFIEGMTADGAENMFPHAATISTDERGANQTISPAQFVELSLRVSQKLSEDGDGTIVIGSDSRYFTALETYSLQDGIDLKILTTTILVEGKILTLATFCLSGSPFEDQFQSSALAWRDAYLKQTKP